MSSLFCKKIKFFKTSKGFIKEMGFWGYSPYATLCIQSGKKERESCFHNFLLNITRQQLPCCQRHIRVYMLGDLKHDDVQRHFQLQNELGHHHVQQDEQQSKSC